MSSFRTDQEFFLDPQRCIGCHACEMAHAQLIPAAGMDRELFENWLTLFRQTVAENFEGPKAGHLLRCAEDMANVIYSKIHHVPDPRFDPAKLTPEQRARYSTYRSRSTETS
jgi:hemoglobin